jgi:hypothetical protein
MKSKYSEGQRKMEAWLYQHHHESRDREIIAVSMNGKVSQM